MKKTVSILLSAALTVGAAVPVFAADTFKDVNEKSYSWAQEYVENMASAGLISGYDDGTFRPGNSVSRMEAFALFARLIGSNRTENAETVEAAKEKYASVLKAYDLSYAEGDVAYMMLRGVLSESELDTYFKGSKKTEAMPRYEAAILITKAMLAEDDAKNEVLIDMDFKDVTDIPKSARQYVYYASQNGIIVGMDDGSFSPQTSVLRGQIAVMLSRTFDSMGYTYDKVKISKIGKTEIEFVNSKGNTAVAEYTDETKFFKRGAEIEASDLKAGQTISLTCRETESGATIAFADLNTLEADSEVSLIYNGYSSKSGKISINTEEPLTGKTSSYDISDSAEIIIDGSNSDINKLNKGSYVTLGLADDVVVSIKTIQQTTTIKDVTLAEIDLFGTVTVESSDAKYDGQTFMFADDVRVIKNGNDSELSALYRGDTLTLTLEYGLVKKIAATSKVQTVNGIIKAYTVSSAPTLTIKKDGEEYTYDLPSDVEVTLNGEKSKLAEFEIGSNVTLTIESEAVKKIAAVSSAGTTAASSLTGVVVGANASANVIILSYYDGDSETQAYITCTSSTKFNIAPALTEYSLKKIKAGDSIVAYGSYTNGIFVASGVTVTSTAD